MYEDLIADPEAVVSELLAACGLQYEPAVLRFHEVSKSKPGGTPGVLTASQAQVRRPLYRGAVGRWRRYERQLAPLAARLAPLVERYEARLAAVQAGRQRSGSGPGSSGAGSSGGNAEAEAARDEL